MFSDFVSHRITSHYTQTPYVFPRVFNAHLVLFQFQILAYGSYITQPISLPRMNLILSSHRLIISPSTAIPSPSIFNSILLPRWWWQQQTALSHPSTFFILNFFIAFIIHTWTPPLHLCPSLFMDMCRRWRRRRRHRRRPSNGNFLLVKRKRGTRHVQRFDVRRRRRSGVTADGASGEFSRMNCDCVWWWRSSE